MTVESQNHFGKKLRTPKSYTGNPYVLVTTEVGRPPPTLLEGA